MSLDKTPDLERYRGYLRVLADMLLNPRLRAKEDVSDVVQQTLLQAHQNLPDFRGTTDAELRVWLKTILTHKLINLAKHYGAQKRDIHREISIDRQLQESAVSILSQIAAEQTSPSEHVMRQEQAEQLADALAGLLEDECTAVVMKYIHGCQVAEIADQLGRTRDAAAGLLRRGIKKLKSTMLASKSDGRIGKPGIRS